MINRDDILSMEYLKKAAYTGSHQGMRYRLEGISGEEGRVLLVSIWPEPYNFITTPASQKQSETFPFAEEGVVAAVGWMNQHLAEFADKGRPGV